MASASGALERVETCGGWRLRRCDRLLPARRNQLVTAGVFDEETTDGGNARIIRVSDVDFRTPQATLRNP
jgi:hypothetical protein